MSGADDWTREVMTKGLPELRQLYKLHGAEESVAGKAWVQFPHNYGQPSREFMYGWFRKHLLNAPGPVQEPPFVPVPVSELRVFDEKHPRPKGELTAKPLREAMAKASDAQLAALPPADRAKVVAAALRAMLGTSVPAVGTVTVAGFASVDGPGYARHAATLGRAGTGDAVPAVGYVPAGFENGRAVLWVHPQGLASAEAGGKLTPEVAALVKAGVAVLAIDVLGVGSQAFARPRAVNPELRRLHLRLQPGAGRRAGPRHFDGPGQPAGQRQGPDDAPRRLRRPRPGRPARRRARPERLRQGRGRREPLSLRGCRVDGRTR